MNPNIQFSVDQWALDPGPVENGDDVMSFLISFVVAGENDVSFD